MIYLTLPSGQKLPALGLGTWQTTDDKDIETAVNKALELGYRHIDTAFVYKNEKAIGRVLKEWFNSGKLKREDLFITTKLPMQGVHQDRVEYFMKKSLENLQLDYVDLYLVHFPVGLKFDAGVEELVLDEKGNVVTEGKTNHAALWKKLEEQVAAGRTKNIGLSNYNISQIQTILDVAKVKPANLQVELHLYLQQPKLVEFCHKNGITVVAYCPLANPSYNTFLEKIGKGEKVKPLPNVLGDATVNKLAQKYSKTPAQIALRFLVEYGISAIPKSVNPKRIAENFDVFDFAFTEDEMKSLKALDQGENGRLADFALFGGINTHPDYPFPLK